MNGVGNGCAIANYEITCPIAVGFEGQHAEGATYEAHVVEGPGENLPAILGSISMAEKDAAIILRKGKEMMVFPGPGGYKIEWSPGTKLLPMEISKSGHYVMPCDRFENMSKAPSQDKAIVFVTDHTPHQ